MARITKDRLETDLVRTAGNVWTSENDSENPNFFTRMWLRMKMWEQKLWSRWFKKPKKKQRRRAASRTDDEIRSVNFRIGWYIFLLFLASGIGLLFRHPPLGMMLLGIDLIYLGTNLHEVRDPNAAFLYRMGKMIGKLGAGWYLTIPHLWTIDIISLEILELEPLTEEMYVKTGTPITLRLRVFYRVVNLGKALFSRTIIQNRIRAVVLTQLKGEVGKKFFSELLKERGTLERAITSEVCIELKPDGYEVTGIEIEDLDETVESQASTIIRIGEARGAAAQALAAPLRNNYPAATVSAVSTITEFAERIVRNIWGSGSGRKQRSPEVPSERSGEEVGKLTEAINRLIERR